MSVMDADIVIKQVDEVHCKIIGDKADLLPIQEHFTFFAEDYRWHPRFKSGFWDGKIRLLNMNTKLLLKGLIPNLIKFCDDNDITYNLDDNLFPEVNYELNDADIVKMYETLKAPYTPKTYQIDAVKQSINSNRGIILSPTASGKSYFLYGIARFYQKMGLKVLILVHRAGLVKQLIDDNFCEEYDCNRNSFTSHKIYAGKEKDVICDITASTWQSIYKMPADFYHKYDVVIADEVHAWTSKSCIAIMEACKHIVYRHGTSGTLQDIKEKRLTLEGLFGPPIKVADTVELMESGDIAKLKIKGLIFNYPLDECKHISTPIILKNDDSGRKAKSVAQKMYVRETKFIEEHPKRHKVLIDLINKYKGNTLVAFVHTDHGKRIYDDIKGDKFYIDGSVPIEKRAQYQKYMDTHNNVTGVVSIGTFAEGINIKNVNRVILAGLLKSKVKLLQLIGRGLRLSAIKSAVIFIDIGDNLRYKKHNNYALNHCIERYKRYKEEKFELEIIEKDI